MSSYLENNLSNSGFSANMLRVFTILTLLLSACSNSTPAQLFMLDANIAAAPDLSTHLFNRSLQVGLGPIHLPEYLNRPQIVIETAKNQYKLDEDHRWAERLDQNISRSLATFLANRLGIEQILIYPWSAKLNIDYQVGIDILELHQSSDGYSHLRAQWRVFHTDQMILYKSFDCEASSSNDATSLVKAQSECLGKLGVDIVAGLQQLTQ